MVVTETAWRLLSCDGSESTDPSTGEIYTTLTMGFESAGQMYCIAVTGPQRLSNVDFVNVCRAAGAKMIAASGGDPRIVSAYEVPASELTKPTGERTQ